MFGRMFIFSSLIWAGCSQPKYVQESTTSGNTTYQETKADCSLKFKSGLCFVWYWESKPTNKQSGSLIFKTFHINSVDQTAVETDLVGPPEVILWVPDMGHGSTPTITERLDVGMYRSSKVFFVMPGRWQLRFQVKGTGENKEAIVEDAKVELTI